MLRHVTARAVPAKLQALLVGGRMGGVVGGREGGAGRVVCSIESVCVNTLRPQRVALWSHRVEVGTPFNAAVAAAAAYVPVCVRQPTGGQPAPFV